MKRYIRIFLIWGIPAAIVWGVLTWSEPWIGMVGGVVYGLAMAIIARYRENRVSESPMVLTNEVLLRKGRASYLNVFGWLYLTDRRVFFEGYETSPEITTLLDEYPTDAVSHDISIPIYTISEAVISRRLGIPWLDIILSDGQTESFGIDDFAGWVSEISTVRRDYLDEPRLENLWLLP